MEGFYALRLRAIWDFFKQESFSFWMVCGYLFVEYVRPQSILPALDFLPWARLFLLGALCGWMANSKAKWVSVSSNKWMVIFLLVIVASVLTAEYPDVSKQHFMDIFSWVIVYFVLVLHLTSPKRFYVLLLIFLFASFKISFSLAEKWALRGFSFTSWGLQGPPGYFTNSGELSIQMLVFGPVAFHLYQAIKSRLGRWKKLLLILMPVTAAMTILGASSRGSQIALVYQIYALFLKGRISVKSLFITAVAATLIYSFLPDEQKQRFQNSGDDKSSQQRLLYWKHGREIIGEHPVLGIGLFNFIPYYEAHYSTDMLYETAQLPHNIFIQVGTDAGYLGLLSYLALIGQVFLLNRRTRKLVPVTGFDDDKFFVAMTKGLDTGMIGFLIAGQFVTVGYYPFIWVNLAFAASLHAICVSKYKA